MKFAKRTRRDIDINLTPLIDVVFLLLIFFMVSTSFIKDSHLSINLPKADARAAPGASARVEISIAEDGSYAVDGISLVDKRSGTLRAALMSALVSGDASEKASEKAQSLIISADAAAPHQAVVTAMDVAGHLGLDRLSITVSNEQAQ